MSSSFLVLSLVLVEGNISLHEKWHTAGEFLEVSQCLTMSLIPPDILLIIWLNIEFLVGNSISSVFGRH
jgi:hypothetical protein